MSAMLPPVSADLKAKLLQIEEQLQFAIREHPNRIALDRIKFALALAKFVRHQVDLDATVDQSLPDLDSASSTRQ
ncbi:MAG TPA: hypothetical protein VFK84_15640 [Burkholderiales bacterium]|nr:hypothetical protein [Burkholderiales bacterium]